jgi:hypothetical protein
MADLTITAANVVATSGTRETLTAGATITAGQLVVLDSTTGRMVLADNNHATAALRIPRGIALHGASNGQPLTILKSGDITIGATLTAGTDYYLSATAGGICPRADLATGHKVVLLGLAESTSVLALDIQDSGVVLA